MKKSLVISLFYILFLAFTVANVSGATCCANVDMQDLYCTASSKDACCPATGTYGDLGAYSPQNVNDCVNTFYSSTKSCDQFGKCSLGCCYDESFSACIGSTRDVCLGLRGAQTWDPGFTDPSDRLDETNPCFNSQGKAAIAQCVQDGAQPCSSLTSQKSCTEKSCFWCKDSCLANCLTCPQGTKDSNNDRICDSAPPIECGVTDRQFSKESCFQANTFCRWCESPSSGGLRCMNSCDGCPSPVDAPDRVCKSGTTQCSDGFDNDRDNKFDLNDFCCSVATDNSEDNSCACSDKGHCCLLKAQCPNKQVDKKSYDISSCATCCEDECLDIPFCEDKVQVKSSRDKLGGFCRCGEEVVNTTASDKKDLFCCANLLSDSACQLIRFTGSVKDKLTGGILEDVELTLQGGITYNFMNNDPPGSFNEFISPGTYVLTARKDGYRVFTTKPPHIQAPTTTERIEYNILLEKMVAKCISEWPPLQISVSPRGCKKDILVNWSFECASKVTSYEVYRDGVLLARLPNTAKSFVDLFTSWEKTFDYQVVARIKQLSPELSKIESDMVSITTGNALCESLCNDETFCTESNGLPNQLSKCNEGNELESTACEDDSVCMVGPEPYCRQPDTCTGTGLPYPNVFGMFYNSGECNTDDLENRRFCYYDYTSTPVDSCKSCLSGMFCYDYDGENACTVDNCKVLKGNRRYPCGWYSNPLSFGELGKGVCFAPGYNGTDYCSRCSSSSVIFENSQCSPTTCDLLGSCYSQKNQKSCNVCVRPVRSDNTQSPTKCSDYTDKRSCIGSTGNVEESDQPFDMRDCGASPRSAVSFIYSKDACGLGVCKWKDNKCIKDANDDSNDDCKQTDVPCQKDSLPPETLVSEKPDRVNYRGSEVKFTIQDYGWGSVASRKFSSYYCIDSTDKCCPTLSFQDKIMLKGDGTVPGLKGVSGLTYLRYYSVDGYYNTEAIKSLALDVDTRPPRLALSYSVMNNTGSLDLSDLYIDIHANEPVFGCVDKLQKKGSASSESLVNDETIDEENGFIISRIYSGLPDGYYKYSINCTDSFGNTNSTVIDYITIDRVRRIINEAPVGVKFTAKQPVTISFETAVNALDCTVEKKLPVGANPVNVRPGAQTQTGFRYTLSLGILPTGYYEYDIICTKDGKAAKKTVFFLVDGIAPATSLLYENSPGSFIPFDSSLYYQKVRLLLECIDPVIPGQIEPFGCAGTFYCTDIAGTCNPTTPADGVIDLSDKDRSFMLVYRSLDAGGNSENPKFTIVRVDRQGPSVEIISPLNGSVFSNPQITLQASWQDNSAKANINILWYAIQNRTKTKSLDFVSSDKAFSKPLVLFRGENLVLVSARDVSVRGGANSGVPEFITLFYDTVGPEFQYSSIMNDLGGHVNTNEADANYARKIIFKLGVQDTRWTKEVRLARLSIICSNHSECRAFSSSVQMSGNKTDFNFTYVPDGLLVPGRYNVTYYAEDKFGNSNTLKDSFTVVDHSSLNASIFNSQGERLDNSGSFAQYSRNILFVSKHSDLDLINTMSLQIRCADEYTCGNYAKSVQMIRAPRGFNYTLVPRATGILLPGVYNATFASVDKFQTIHKETLHFEVQDSSALLVSITNHKRERIDNRAAKAQYSRFIVFNVTPSDKDMFSSVKVLVVCQNATACGDYRSAFDTVRKGNSFVYTLNPVKGADALYDPDIGTYKALFVMLDNFIVNRTILRNFTVVDTEGAYVRVNFTPETQPSIFNPFTRQFKVGAGINQCRWYKVVFDANKPVVIKDLIADVFEYPGTRHPIIDFKNMPKPLVSPNGDIWTFKFCVPFASPIFKWLRGNNTRLRFTASDRNNISVDEDSAENTFFELDTHGGDEPLLIQDVKDYTRDPNLVIVGYTNPQEPSLKVFLDVAGMVYETTASAISTNLGEDEAYLAAQKGSTELEFQSDKSLLFAPGRFVEFGHSRQNGKLYRIVSSSFFLGTGSTHIMIQPALEEGVAELEHVVVFDRETPTGWFQFTPTVSKEGNHTLSIWAVDEFGNIGKKYVKRFLYLNRPVEITKYSPRNHDVFAQKQPNISVTIHDVYGVVNTSSIKLVFNGTTHGCESGLLCERDKDYLLVWFRPDHELSDRKYLVSFSVRDIVGNSNSVSWDFTVDSRVPVLKQLKFVPAVYYPAPYDSWYTRSETIVLFAEFTNGTIAAQATLVENSSVKFICEAEQSSVECTSQAALKDRSYSVVLNYYYQLLGGSGSIGQLTREVVIDTKMPVVRFESPYPSKRLARLVSGTYNDSNLDENDVIMVEGASLVSSVKARLSHGVFEANVFLKGGSAEGNHTISAIATDKAGNIGRAQSVLIYDLHASPLVIVSVEPNDTSKTVSKVNSTFYLTNVGTRTNGIKIRGYAERGTVDIFTSYQDGNDTTEEVLQGSVFIPSQFLIPATLFNPNGKNFFRFVGTDLANNSYSASLMISSDTNGPEAPFLEIEKSIGQMIPLGRTGTTAGGVQDPSVCFVFEEPIVRDSCLINLLLSGNKNVCKNITNTELKASCVAMS